MPFAGYKNFKECVAKNKGKKDPEAYCATIMRATEEEMPTLVHEVIDVSEAEFTRDETTGKMTARVRIISAGKAKGKPRRYTSEAVRRAAREGIYDGLRMFVNHSDKPPTKRNYEELVSAVESTDYDPKTDSVMGNVEFFDEKFYDKAQRARKHMGLSADHRIAVTRVQEGRENIELVHQIVGARSVDWVVYPAAGGEIISFARESEGADDVEWSEITPELLKEKAPEVYAQIVKESEGDGEPEPDPKPDPKPDPEPVITKADIAKLVQEGVQEALNNSSESQRKREEAQKKVRAYVSQAGLRGRTQDRLVAQFADRTEYVEADVKEAVDNAQLELKELGVGPKIKGNGPTTAGAVQEGESEEQPVVIRARESVEAFFKKPAKKEPATAGAAASGEES